MGHRSRRGGGRRGRSPRRPPGQAHGSLQEKEWRPPGCTLSGRQGDEVLETEYARVEAGEKMAGMDTRRYNLDPPPAAKRNDVGAWRAALDNAHSQLEHQYNRRACGPQGRGRAGGEGSVLAWYPRICSVGRVLRCAAHAQPLPFKLTAYVACLYLPCRPSSLAAATRAGC